MRTPSLSQFRIFLSVVETGTVSGAARALGISQPAASQQLRELERLVSLRLLERAGGNMVPTSAGLALLEPARRARAAAEEAMDIASRHRQGDSGLVRIGSGATACIFFLPTIIGAVRQSAPGLNITVSIGDPDEVMLRLEKGELDIGVCTLPLNVSRSLMVVPLITDPMVALLPEGQSLGDKPITALELNAFPLILYESGWHTRSVTDNWFRQAGIEPRPVMELGSVEAIKVLVGSGLGASVLPQMAIPSKVPGAISRVLDPAPSRRLGYVIRNEKIVDRGLRLVLAEMERSATVPQTGQGEMS